MKINTRLTTAEHTSNTCLAGAQWSFSTCIRSAYKTMTGPSAPQVPKSAFSAIMQSLSWRVLGQLVVSISREHPNAKSILRRGTIREQMYVGKAPRLLRGQDATLWSLGQDQFAVFVVVAIPNFLLQNESCLSGHHLQKATQGCIYLQSTEQRQRPHVLKVKK